MKALSLPAAGDDARLTSGFSDDFDHLNTERWTTIATDAGTATVGDTANGCVTLAPSDGTVADNDEVYIHTAELFKLLAERPLTFRCLLSFAEANTDDANVVLGYMSGVAANHLLDNGAGPAASYSGVVFYKVDGETVWTVENSIGTTQKTTKLDADNSLSGVDVTAGGASFQLVEFEIVPRNATYFDVWFKVDDVVVAKHTNQPLASATEMAVVIGAKNGGANNESIVVDLVQAYQKRGY
jgi:hypothetical protein